MKKLFVGFLCAAGLALSGSSVFAVPEYDVDLVHSSVGFSITHMMVSKVTGGFDQAKGVILFDPADLANSRLEVKIDAASINTRNKQRDDHLRGADFFEVDKFPSIDFVSKKIVKQAEGIFMVMGDLTMKGVTHEVQVPVSVIGPVINPMSKNPVIGLEAHFKVNRQDYGVKWNKTLDNGGLMLANDVNVDVSIEADKSLSK